MNPKLLLQLEGAAVFTASTSAYRFNHGSWWLFALLFLAPDLSMIGYTCNGRVGAACYNAFTPTLPLFYWLHSVTWRANRRVLRSPSSGWLTLVSIGCSVSASNTRTDSRTPTYPASATERILQLPCCLGEACATASTKYPLPRSCRNVTFVPCSRGGRYHGVALLLRIHGVITV